MSKHLVIVIELRELDLKVDCKIKGTRHPVEHAELLATALGCVMQTFEQLCGSVKASDGDQAEIACREMFASTLGQEVVEFLFRMKK